MNRQGRNERIYNRREIIDENETIIPPMSVGAAPTQHSFSTSSLVSSRRVGEISSIANNHLRVNNDDVSLSESYGFVVPYMYDAQTHRRRCIDLPNNNLYSRNVRNINMNLSSNTVVESGSVSSTMNAIHSREYSTDFVLDQDVHVHLPLKRTSTMREFGEGSSSSGQARPTRGEHIGQSFSQQPMTTQHVQGINSIYAPNMINHYHFQTLNNMSPLLGRGIPYLGSLPIHPQQNVFSFGNIHQPNAIEWTPQINLHQQEHHHGTQTIMSPLVPSTTSSILENLQRSIATTPMIQVGGGNAEQQPLLQQTLDTELMRQMAIEWDPQVNLHQQEYHPSTQTTLSPHVPFTTSSIIENLQRSIVTSDDMIQVGGNVEQQPLFNQTLDPQLMREVTQTQVAC
ncbi:uncharacterized protein [Cicer arietinum]|uniref:uncharacterized protein n=1 Tax=Cicer arietinum TaxID=3827 RepID=UPI003CC60088